MAIPLTREDLRDELNDRFEHYEKRQNERHREMIQGFAEVIESVNAHMDERFDELKELLELKGRVDKMQVLLAEQFGVDALTRAGL